MRACELLAALALLVGCAAGTSPAPPPSADLFVLTAANELVGVTAEGRIVLRRQLARARRPSSPSPRLGLDGGRLYVLVRRDAPPDRMVVLDRAAARPLVARSLPADFRARAVVVGSGRVFVGGNRPVRQAAPGAFEEDAVVLELDRSALLVRRFTVRAADGRDWWVTSAALAPNGRRLAISYHGGCGSEAPDLCTEGADVIGLMDGTRERCSEPHAASGCIEAHGRVDFYDSSLVATTGSEEVRVGDVAVATRLGNSHVMDFALDRVRRKLVVSGPCQHQGGVSVVDLWARTARLLVAPGPLATPQVPSRTPCGSRLALLPDVVALAPVTTAVGDPRLGGRVLLVDRRTGRVRARLPLRAEPVDVVAVP